MKKKQLTRFHYFEYGHRTIYELYWVHYFLSVSAPIVYYYIYVVYRGNKIYNRNYYMLQILQFENRNNSIIQLDKVNIHNH